MKTGEGFRHLAVLFDYPQDKAALLAAAESLAGCLEADAAGMDPAHFAAYVRDAGLGELQEEYVRTFDFNPLCAPYMGHHLHGDTSGKGEFMVRLKELYRQHAFTPRTCELPDHIATLFECAAHLHASGDYEARRRLISGFVLEGLEKMKIAAEARDDLRWRYPIAAAVALSAADRLEVHHA